MTRNTDTILRTVSFARMAAVGAVLLVAAGCEQTRQPTRPTQPLPPAISSLTEEPTLRVRVAAGKPVVRITGPAVVSIGPTPDRGTLARARQFRTPLNITRRDGRFVIRPDRGQAVAWALPALYLTANPAITLENTSYPAQIYLYPHVTQSGPTDRLDAVNHVLLETYLPGVLEGELYSSWHPQAFATQAIAARSYAIAVAARHRDQHYDLESTTASQVYGGVARNPKAIEAARQTRGQVITDNGRVVCAYYSSTCGGVGQDAAIAFPDGPNIAPLRGKVRGTWCSPSKFYRWGPMTRSSSTLARRIAAWGRANKHGVGRLRGLRAIVISANNSAGRPAQFTITDTRGRRYQLKAEQFRHACNYSGAGLGKVSDKTRLRSSHVQVRVAGQSVQFTQGRGFGHGVGLCQYGAQALAMRGHNPTAILKHYYNNATVERAY